MLVVEDPLEVRIYSALTRPEARPASGRDDDRLVDVLDRVASAMQLADLVRSVETGQFYREYPTKFRPERAVDQYLLTNLGETRDQLCEVTQPYPLKPAAAHAFLGRCLFTCYLLERGIIGEQQLARAGAKNAAAKATTLRELLEYSSATDAIEVLYKLFGILKDDFNGSMFHRRLGSEKQSIRKRHIDVLHTFLRGDEMKSRQSVIFPLYDFRFIPIEFISAIYEDFLVAEDETPKARRGNASSEQEGKRRKAGAYYTPPRLAELVVDIATQECESLLNLRCLDPACGSGIFLVILFQRMAEEWRRRNTDASNTQRARALRNLLTKNLCGVDVNETACMVACFSLYLAFLDQFDDPRDIWLLADELKQTGSEKVLPQLLASEGDDDSECPENPALYVANFFSSSVPSVEFDLVIGNPPWVGRNQPADRDMERWVLNNQTAENPSANPFIHDVLENSRDLHKRRRVFFPNRQSANAFMWKTPLHIKQQGNACLLLPSKVLLANQVNEFQAAWLRQFSVLTVWQLSDYRWILFEGAVCPAIVMKFNRCPPNCESSQLDYVVPKVDRSSPRKAEIQILADDRKTLALKEVLGAADHGNALIAWKKHFWGTGRDQQMLDALLALPKLSDLADRPGKKRWAKGRGFQPFHEEFTTGEPKPARWDESHLYLDAKTSVAGLILLPSDCEKVGNRFSKLRRLPEQAIFSPPMVLFDRAGRTVAYVDFPLIFQDMLSAITGPQEDADLLLFLTAVLSSPFAQYFLFHTSANLGVERDTVLLDEYLRMPFPLPEQTRKPAVNQSIINEVVALMRRTQSEITSLQSDLFLGFDEQRQVKIDEVGAELSNLINDYYGLAAWERALITDTTEIFEPSATPSSVDKQIPTLQRTEADDHRKYAELLCSTLNAWLKRHPWKIEASTYISRRYGLGLLCLTKSTQPKEFTESPAGEKFESVLLRIREETQKRQGGVAYARGVAYFDSDALYILKPLTLRNWARTAALNDADKLMQFMARLGGAI